MVFYERASGSRMHANYFRRRRRASGPAAEADRRYRGVVRPVPEDVVDDIDTLLTGNRIFKQRNVDIGVVSLEDAWKWGFSGVMVRGSGARLGSAQDAALRVLCRDGFRHSGRQERRLLRPLSDPHGRDAPVGADHEAVPGEAECAGRQGPVSAARQQDRAAEARRDEALDGSADPSLQALHRGLSRAGGRGLCLRRGAEGRVRRLSRRGRHQQALSLQDPRAGFAHLQAMDLLCKGHMLADVVAILGSLDIVFGEIDR